MNGGEIAVKDRALLQLKLLAEPLAARGRRRPAFALVPAAPPVVPASTVAPPPSAPRR